MRNILVYLIVAVWVSPAYGDSVSVAREHYQKGTKAYDLGHFIEAADEYEAAYRIVDDPKLLFNIGQAYRLGSDNAKALYAYRGYLRRLPDAPNRAQVETKIAELRKLIEEQQHVREAPPVDTLPPPATTTTTTQPAIVVKEAPVPATPVYKKWWLWTVVGGVVVAGVAVGLGVGLAQGVSSERTLAPIGAP